MDIAAKPPSPEGRGQPVSDSGSSCGSTVAIYGSMKAAGLSSSFSPSMKAHSTAEAPEHFRPAPGIMKRKAYWASEVLAPPTGQSVTFSTPITSPEDLFHDLGIKTVDKPGGGQPLHEELSTEGKAAQDKPSGIIQEISEQCLQLTRVKSHFSRHVRKLCRTPAHCSKASVGLHELFNSNFLAFLHPDTEAFQRLADSREPSACTALYEHLKIFEHNLSLISNRAVKGFGNLQTLIAACARKRELLENLSNNCSHLPDNQPIENVYREQFRRLDREIGKRLSLLHQDAIKCLCLPYVVNAPVVLMFRETDRIIVFNLVPDRFSDDDILVVPMGSALTKQARWMLTQWLRLADFRFYGEPCQTTGAQPGVMDGSRVFSLKPEQGNWPEWQESVVSAAEEMPVTKTRITSSESSSSSTDEHTESVLSAPLASEVAEPPVTMPPLTVSEPLDDELVSSLLFSHAQVVPILGTPIDPEGSIDHQIALLELCCLIDEDSSRPIREALQQKILPPGQTRHIRETETLLRDWLSSTHKDREGFSVTFRLLFRMLLEVSEALTDEQKETMKLALNNAMFALINEPACVVEPESRPARSTPLPSQGIATATSETVISPPPSLPSVSAATVSEDDLTPSGDIRQFISKPQRISETTHSRLTHLGLQVESTEYKTAQGALLSILYPHIRNRTLSKDRHKRMQSLKRLNQTLEERLTDDMKDALEDKDHCRDTIKLSLEICSVLGGHTDGSDCLIHACASEELMQRYRPVSSIYSAIERACVRARAVAGDHDQSTVDTLIEHISPLNDPLLLQTLTSWQIDKNVVLFFEDPKGNLYIFNSDKSEFPRFKSRYRVKDDQIFPSNATVWIKPGTPVTEQNEKPREWLGGADLCLYNQFRVVDGKIRLTLTQELKPVAQPTTASPPQQLGGLNLV